MLVKATKLSANYKVFFSRPAVELLTNATRVIESLTKSLGSAYPIQSDSLRIINSTVAGDVSISIQVFNGNGKIKVTVDSIEATFDNISSRADVGIVTNALDLMAAGIAPFFADVPVQTEQLSTNIILHVEGDANQIPQYFSAVQVPGNLYDYEYRGIKLAKRVDDAVSIQASLEPHWSVENSLLLYVWKSLSGPVRKSKFESKIQEFEEITRKTLRALDLTIVGEGN